MPLPEIADALLRALAMLAGGAAAGLAVFRLTGAQQVPAQVVPLVRRLIIAATVFSTLHVLAQPARYTGSFGDTFSPAWLGMALSSSFGAGAALRVIALLVLWTSTGQAGRRAGLLAGTGWLLLAASHAQTGHVTADRFAGTEMSWVLAVHVALFSLWLGSLLGLHRQLRMLDAAARTKAAREVSRGATFWFPLLLAAGLWLAFRLLSWPVHAHPYVWLLLTKLLLVAVATSLAALNRWRWTPLLESRPADGARAMLRSIRAELLLVIVLVAVTVSMTTWTSPQ